MARHRPPVRRDLVRGDFAQSDLAGRGRPRSSPARLELPWSSRTRLERSDWDPIRYRKIGSNINNITSDQIRPDIDDIRSDWIGSDTDNIKTERIGSDTNGIRSDPIRFDISDVRSDWIRSDPISMISDQIRSDAAPAATKWIGLQS